MAFYLVTMSIKNYDPDMTITDLQSIELDKVYFPCLALLFINFKTGESMSKPLVPIDFNINFKLLGKLTIDLTCQKTIVFFQIYECLNISGVPKKVPASHKNVPCCSCPKKSPTFRFSTRQTPF